MSWNIVEKLIFPLQNEKWCSDSSHKQNHVLRFLLDAVFWLVEWSNLFLLPLLAALPFPLIRAKWPDPLHFWHCSFMALHFCKWFVVNSAPYLVDRFCGSSFIVHTGSFFTSGLPLKLLCWLMLSPKATPSLSASSGYSLSFAQLLLYCFLLKFWMKASFFPLFVWSPNSHFAASPVETFQTCLSNPAVPCWRIPICPGFWSRTSRKSFRCFVELLSVWLLLPPCRGLYPLDSSFLLIPMIRTVR